MKRVKFKRNIFNEKKLKMWARRIKIRDNFKCVACGYKGALHSHHILKKSKYRQYVYDLNNGVTLCVICHMSSNGVHGSDKPRNTIVSQLRLLMKEGNYKKVCEFTLKYKNTKKKIRKVRLSKKKRKYSPYKKLKRKFY